VPEVFFFSPLWCTSWPFGDVTRRSDLFGTHSLFFFFLSCVISGRCFFFHSLHPPGRRFLPQNLHFAWRFLRYQIPLLPNFFGITPLFFDWPVNLPPRVSPRFGLWPRSATFPMQVLPFGPPPPIVQVNPVALFSPLDLLRSSRPVQARGPPCVGQIVLLCGYTNPPFFRNTASSSLSLFAFLLYLKFLTTLPSPQSKFSSSMWTVPPPPQKLQGSSIPKPAFGEHEQVPPVPYASSYRHRVFHPPPGSIPPLK